MLKNIKVSCKTRKKRTLVIYKNVFIGHWRGWINWVHNKVIGIYSSARSFERLKGRKTMEKMQDKPSTKIFAVRITTGQERNVAKRITAKIKMAKIPIKAILVPETLKGYIFIEADGPHFVEEAIAGIRHVRSRVPDFATFSDVEKYVIRK